MTDATSSAEVNRAVGDVVARARKKLDRYFAPEWVRQCEERRASHSYPTVKSAVRAFEKLAEETPAHSDLDSRSRAPINPHAASRSAPQSQD